VDTSTGVLADVRSLAALSKKYGVLSIVDGVCSVAGEMIRMSDWEVDVVLTASQKAIGVPPGLALMVVSPKAIQVFNQRKSLVSSYYGDWNHWLPIMQSYESRKPAYFATPAVNLVYALQVSLSKILSEGIEKRVARHEKISNACKAGIEALGLAQVPLNPKISAHTMTAPRYVAGINPQDFLAGATQAGVILAGGLHPVIRNEYFRIGHMGSVNLGDILAVLSAVETSLLKCGLRIEPGISLKAAQDSYSE
jgi:alanine-glyoxylate transaminase/serine-glyoxylate transaminase/serine-pyruvate transaminase